MRIHIQSLRAIAVLAVVLFHLWRHYIVGGFVGVDIFFVISGYLITGHLVRELLTTGTISIRNFYARRAVRLLPEAFLVLTLTGIATYLLADESLWKDWMPQFASSAIYIENWHLANYVIDHLGIAPQPSPVQHFWSLSVEEQFYLFVPLILIVVTRYLKLTKLSSRTVVLTAIATVTIVSFFYCVWSTFQNFHYVYVSTLSRAWEFAIGALLAVIPKSTKIAPRGMRPVAFLLLGACFLFLKQDSNFPGYIALIPVAGAVLWILAEPRKITLFDRTLKPIGDVSYAFYLWHWPVIILWNCAKGGTIGLLDKCLILVLSIAIAFATTHLFENRIRFANKFEQFRKPATVATWALAGMIAISLASLTFIAN